MHKFECSPENAPKFLEWIKTCGGLAHWQSQDLGNLGQSWTTPALTPDGQPTPPPTWQCKGTTPIVCSNADEVSVITDKEVKRFRVAVKRGYGFSFVLTDASDRKIKNEIDKLGEMASYHFDYDTQEVVLTVPDSVMTLTEWAKVNLVTT